MKRWKVIVILIITAILVIAAAIFLHTPEPSYQGKSLTQWMDDYATFTASGTNTLRLPTDNTLTPFRAAFGAMGTNSLPFVFSRLEQQDSPFWSYYRTNWPKMPKLLRRVLPAPKPVINSIFVRIMVSYSSHGPLPFTLVMHELRSSSLSTRSAAIHGLSFSKLASPQREEAISVLTELIQQSDNPYIQSEASFPLGNMAPASSNMPSLH